MSTDNKAKGFLEGDRNPNEIQNNEWKNILPDEIYHIAREKGTERPGTGNIINIKK